jgi:cytochrome c nitrite reductase small subunit
MPKLPFIVAIAAAIITLGFFGFVSNAPAYGGSEPETCANCHVMDSQYDNWYHAPHDNFTECVDCHLPDENKILYYLEKGRQGAKDVYAFTTGNIPVAIRASEIESEKIHIEEDTVRSDGVFLLVDRVDSARELSERACRQPNRNGVNYEKAFTNFPCDHAFRMFCIPTQKRSGPRPG